jgi:outer-membrane receptor for ferric coprogen and ferric-rhodotorulic acid
LEFLCTTVSTTVGDSCYGKKLGDPYFNIPSSSSNQDFSWPPSVSLSYDVNHDLTAYLGYTDVYISQSQNLTSDRKPLEPVTGANYEFGLKWAARGGRLNLSAAGFLSRKRNFAIGIGQTTDVGGGQRCCYGTDPNRVQESRGLDLEASGELQRGWQIAASYTYAVNENKGSYFGANEGTAFTTIAPANLYKIWTSIDLGAVGVKGWARKLTVSGGVNGQSSAFNSGFICVNYIGQPDPLTGSQACKSYRAPDFIKFAFTVPSYAVVSGRLDYKFNDRFQLALNLINLLDKRYYESTGGDPSGGNWYGSPRAFKLTAQAKF